MEASTLPPLVASLSQRSREPGQVKMMPPPRSSPITVDLPSTMYRPNSGPPLAPISLLPVQDTTGYITDRRLMPSPGLAKDGRPLPPILTYLVRWTDAPAARNLVPVKEILDYVSPAAVEEFERNFEAELDEQRAQKEAEKEERRRLKAATAVTGAVVPVVKEQKGKKKRGRPPKHKANDIAPITAEAEDEDVSHKKFRPGSMSLSTPKKSRAMMIPLDEEMGDGTETPVEYDELAGESVNYLDDMEMEDGHEPFVDASKLQDSAVVANAPDGPGGVEDNDESDSDDENYSGLEIRKPESMSYQQTPLYDSDDEIMMSIEDPDHGAGRMNIDAEIERRQSRNQKSSQSPALPDAAEPLRISIDAENERRQSSVQESSRGTASPDVSDPLWHQNENSRQPAEVEKQVRQCGVQETSKKTPIKHLRKKRPLQESVKDCDKIEKRESPEHKRGPMSKLLQLPGHKPIISETPIPLPVIPGMKKTVPKETPVPLPFLPGMHRISAVSAATTPVQTPVQTPSHASIGFSQPKLASCSQLPSLRPPSFSSQRPGLHKWFTETPVLPPKVPKTTTFKMEPTQYPSKGLGLREWATSNVAGASNGDDRVPEIGSITTVRTPHTSDNVSATTNIGRSEEMTGVDHEESLSTSPAPPSTTADSAPRKRKRQSLRGLVPIERDEDGEEFWEVRVIIDHKDDFNEEEELLGRQYLVVWEGNWPLTWEDEENFVDQGPVTQYWNRRMDKKRALFKRYKPKGRMLGTSSRFYGEKGVKIEMADERSESNSEVRSTRTRSIEDDDTPEKRRRRSSRMTQTLRMELLDGNSEDDIKGEEDEKSDRTSVDVAREVVDQEEAEEGQQPGSIAEAAPVAPVHQETPSAGFRAVNAIKATLGWPFGVASG